MERQIRFFLILAIAVTAIVILVFVTYIIPETVNDEIKRLKENIATLQNEATLTAERTNATVTSIMGDYTSVTNSATSVANNFNLLAATATSIAATATSQAPVTVRVKELETVDLFGRELSITLDGYSSVILPGVTFTVRSLESARQTFDGVDLDEAVFYKGKNKYTILVSDISEEEDGKLVVEFVVSIASS